MSNEETYWHPEGPCGPFACPGNYIAKWRIFSGRDIVVVAGCDRGHATVLEQHDMGSKNRYYCWVCPQESIAQYEGRYCSAACQTADARNRLLDMVYGLLSQQPEDRDPAYVREVVDAISGWADHVTGQSGPQVGELG